MTTTELREPITLAPYATAPGVGDAPPRRASRRRRAVLGPFAQSVDDLVRAFALEPERAFVAGPLRLDHPDALAHLARLIGDEGDELLRWAAVRALALGPSSDRCAELLARAARDPEPLVRDEAARALAERGLAVPPSVAPGDLESAHEHAAGAQRAVGSERAVDSHEAALARELGGPIDLERSPRALRAAIAVQVRPFVPAELQRAWHRALAALVRPDRLTVVKAGSTTSDDTPGLGRDVSLEEAHLLAPGERISALPERCPIGFAGALAISQRARPWPRGASAHHVGYLVDLDRGDGAPRATWILLVRFAFEDPPSSRAHAEPALRARAEPAPRPADHVWRFLIDATTGEVREAGRARA